MRRPVPVKSFSVPSSLNRISGIFERGRFRVRASIGFSSAGALSISMDPRGEPLISTWKKPCQKIQNGSEFPELVAQIFRNPQDRSACPKTLGFLKMSVIEMDKNGSIILCTKPQPPSH